VFGASISTEHALKSVATLAKRSFTLAGHRTSVALEDEFWQAIAAIAASRRCTMTALVAEVDAARDPDRPLASALRIFALTQSR
jgi:predicted DNA-binding ribbon-helix-helix protein